jgi:hypothetical protein
MKNGAARRIQAGHPIVRFSNTFAGFDQAASDALRTEVRMNSSMS